MELLEVIPAVMAKIMTISLFTTPCVNGWEMGDG